MNGHFNRHVADFDSDLDNGSSFTDPKPLPLPELTARINAKVQRFLKQTPKDEQTRHVQEQTKISLEAIKKALDRYE
jgi:hypothetical protein